RAVAVAGHDLHCGTLRSTPRRSKGGGLLSACHRTVNRRIPASVRRWTLGFPGFDHAHDAVYRAGRDGARDRRPAAVDLAFRQAVLLADAGDLLAVRGRHGPGDGDLLLAAGIAAAHLALERQHAGAVLDHRDAGLAQFRPH